MQRSSRNIRKRHCAIPVANRDGSALIITLLLVTILVALVTNFVYEVYIDSSALSNWSNAQRASYIARSGQNISAGYLGDIKKRSYTNERTAVLPVDRSLGEDTSLIVTVEDENAKFNVNSIIYPNGMMNDKALGSLKKLLEYLNINPDLSLFVADWIDPDSEPRLPDAENNAKNNFLWSPEEMRFIKGFDDTVWKAVKPYITVYGDSQININTAKLPVLISLNSDMTEELAQRIIEYRESTPFENKNYIVRVSGLEALGMLFIDRITVKAAYVRIVSRASVNNITRSIESVVNTSMKIQYWRET